MIFSSKIYKINSGKNVTLFQNEDNKLRLYLFDKSLKLYDILLNKSKNCVFINQFNYKKIIQLNTETICPCNNGYISLNNENNL